MLSADNLFKSRTELFHTLVIFLKVFWKSSADNKKACKIPSMQVQVGERYLCCVFGPWHQKTCLREFGNYKGGDQPAHPCRLISAFVIRLVSVAEQAGLNLTLSGTLKTGFVASRPILLVELNKSSKWLTDCITFHFKASFLCLLLIRPDLFY